MSLSKAQGGPMQELSLHILDLAQNAVEAGAQFVGITLSEDPARGTLSVAVSDNGRGMDAKTLARASDRHFSTKPHSQGGLGLPLFRLAAEQTGGRMWMASAPGFGTTVFATFYTGHPAYRKVGNMTETFVILMVGHPGLSLSYTRSCGERSFSLSTDQMRQTLGQVPLSAGPVVKWTAMTIEQQTALLRSEA
ncbi:MAG: ATP-binding protein [Clostridiales bacterium]|nr:ATP-binding protein [Clostridiales bacterium]